MKLHPIVTNNPIPFFFHIIYLSNNYRDPLLRLFEKEFDLTRPEFSILVCLGLQDGMSAIEISEITRQPQNTISRGVYLLCRKKLISKKNDKNDKRRYKLYATKKGTRKYQKIMVHLNEANDKMVACLTAKERKQLDVMLEKMCESTDMTSPTLY